MAHSDLARHFCCVFEINKEGSKVFFSEEKKQKTFKRWRRSLRKSRAQRMKVFWFFFSKKNFLSSFNPLMAH
jgi:hypothetical protein